MNEKKVYLVFPSDEVPELDFSTVFSSQEDAEAFTRKYKENTEFVIIEKTIDNPIATDTEKSPYSVWFHGDDFKFDMASLEDYNDNEKLAIQNKYLIYHEGEYHTNTFIQYLMASSKKEAIAIATKKRDELIELGEIRIAVKK